jgi:GTP-binding protein Era
MSNSYSKEFLSGFIAIIGPPNVGKSTLLNRMLGEKISIVSPKPQTTRNRVMGIYHGDGFQIAFIDTPGIHDTRTTLHKSMVSSAQEALSEVDILILVIEMPKPHDPELSLILKNIKKLDKQTILVINKIDTGPKENLLPIIDNFSSKHQFDEIFPVSALKGQGIEKLIDGLKKKIKPGPEFFPKDMSTDQPETFLISEIIREKIYSFTSRELPYSSAVTVEKMDDIPKKRLLSISAIIYVESESQKAIMIGNRGRMIKKIGRASRLELEKVFGCRVYLDLLVRVEKNWSNDTKALRKLGY